MKTVAIFGDSYAESAYAENPTSSWFDYLRSDFRITNFGMRGSGVYYSYKLFLKHYKDFDKIIFIKSTPGRIMLPETLELEDHLFWARHIPNLNVAEVNSKSKNLVSISKYYNAATQYFLYLFDNEKETTIDNLMVDHILRLRPDTILIKTLEPSEEFTLFKVTLKQFEGWKIDLFNKNLFSMYKEILNSHMTPENNEIFGRKMIAMLKGENVTLSVDDFEYPRDPFEKYFIKRK